MTCWLQTHHTSPSVVSMVNGGQGGHEPCTINKTCAHQVCPPLRPILVTDLAPLCSVFTWLMQRLYVGIGLTSLLLPCGSPWLCVPSVRCICVCDRVVCQCIKDFPENGAAWVTYRLELELQACVAYRLLLQAHSSKLRLCDRAW